MGGVGTAGVNRALPESSIGEMVQTSKSVQIGERVHIGEGLRIGERVQICDGVQVVGEIGKCGGEQGAGVYARNHQFNLLSRCQLLCSEHGFECERHRCRIYAGD